MNILSVNAHESYGGAARIAINLHKNLRLRNHNAFYAVKKKKNIDPFTFAIPVLPPRPGIWTKRFWQLRDHFKNNSNGFFSKAALWLFTVLADPKSDFERRIGHEIFQYPGSRKILELPPIKPDILHLHNLHNNYFDLNYLRELSTKLPVVLTLHDEWLLTGHCAAPLECPRWETGCGHCPDLKIYPAIPMDGTRFNWRRKQKIYADSRLFVAAPSEWLMKRARRSMLAPAIVESRVIPNGVDQEIFKPADKIMIRRELGLDPSAKIILVQTGGNFRANPFKDFETTRQCVSILLEKRQEKILILAIGPLEQEITFQSYRVKIFPFASSQELLAKYYQAADVFLHSAFSDNFPSVILESLSSGTPVIATAVGGIPEQVKDGENGFLVEKKNPTAMANKAMDILNDSAFQKQLGEGALSSSRPNYSLERMVDRYEAWYCEILDRQTGIL